MRRRRGKVEDEDPGEGKGSRIQDPGSRIHGKNDEDGRTDM